MIRVERVAISPDASDEEIQGLCQARCCGAGAPTAARFIQYLRRYFPALCTTHPSAEQLSSTFRLFESFEARRLLDPLDRAVEEPPLPQAQETRKANAQLRAMAIEDMCTKLSASQWKRQFGFSREGYRKLEVLLGCELLPGKSATKTALSPRETLLTALFYCRAGRHFPCFGFSVAIGGNMAVNMPGYAFECFGHPSSPCAPVLQVGA